MAKKIDLCGVRFGRLVALSEAPAPSSPSRLHTGWLCLCDCGAQVVVKTNSLRSGNAKSCGCLKKDLLRNRAGFRAKYPKEYTVWWRMKFRCTNNKSPDYKDYGGRGISVCDKWMESFDNFIKDMGPRPSDLHSIGRIDNDGNYCPDNCRWETNWQQSRNKRNNVNITFNGRTMVLQDWANEIGICWTSLYERLQKYPLELALKPIKKEKK